MENNRIEYNEKMKKRLSKLRKNVASINGSVEKLWPDFYEVKGLILCGENGHYTDDGADKLLSGYFDGVDVESSFSEFRIVDYFEVNSIDEQLSVAMLIAEIWECRFRQLFPSYSFRIVISCDDEDVNVRYYRHREGEQELFGGIDDAMNAVEIIYIEP